MTTMCVVSGINRGLGIAEYGTEQEKEALPPQPLVVGPYKLLIWLQRCVFLLVLSTSVPINAPI